MRRSRASKLRAEAQFKKSKEKRKSTLYNSKNIITATAMVLLTSIIHPFTPVRAESLGSSSTSESSTSSSSSSGENGQSETSSSVDSSTENTASDTGGSTDSETSVSEDSSSATMSDAGESGQSETSSSVDSSVENTASDTGGSTDSETSVSEDSSSATMSDAGESGQSETSSGVDSSTENTASDTGAITDSETSVSEDSMSATTSDAGESGQSETSSSVDLSIENTVSDTEANTNSETSISEDSTSSPLPTNTNVSQQNTQEQSQIIETNPSQHQTVPVMPSPEAEQSQEVGVVNNQTQGGQSQQTTVHGVQNQNSETEGNSSIEQSTSADIVTKVGQSTNESSTSTSANQSQKVGSKLEQEQTVVTENGAKVSQGQANDIVAAQQGNLSQKGNVTGVQAQHTEINGAGEVKQTQTNDIQLGQSQYQYNGDLKYGNLQAQGADVNLQQQQSAKTTGDLLKMAQAQGVILGMDQNTSQNVGAANVLSNSIVEMVKQARDTLVNITHQVKFNSFEEVLNWSYILNEENKQEVKEKEYSWNFDWGSVKLDTKIDTSAISDNLSASIESLLSVIYNDVSGDSYNWLFEDSDSDGLLNGEEQLLGLDPYKVSSGNDGIPDMVKKVLLQHILESDADTVDLFKGLLFQSFQADAPKDRAIPQYLNGVLINPEEEMEVKKSIFENIEAIREGNVQEYMKYISEKAATFEQTEQSISNIFENFRLDIKIDQIEILQANANEVKVLVQQTTNKLNGPEFQDNRSQIVHTLVKEDGMFKILNSNVVRVDKIDQQ